MHVSIRTAADGLKSHCCFCPHDFVVVVVVVLQKYEVPNAVFVFRSRDCAQATTLRTSGRCVETIFATTTAVPHRLPTTASRRHASAPLNILKVHRRPLVNERAGHALPRRGGPFASSQKEEQTCFVCSTRQIYWLATCGRVLVSQGRGPKKATIFLLMVARSRPSRSRCWLKNP